MTRLVRLGKAALALVLLAVLIVAAPVVLASFGNPIGDAVDTFADQLASDATRTEAVLVAVLATVGWVCWAMVLTALLTETVAAVRGTVARRSEEHTSELQSLMRISYAVSCLNTKTNIKTHTHHY